MLRKNRPTITKWITLIAIRLNPVRIIITKLIRLSRIKLFISAPLSSSQGANLPHQQTQSLDHKIDQQYASDRPSESQQQLSHISQTHQQKWTHIPLSPTPLSIAGVTGPNPGYPPPPQSTSSTTCAPCEYPKSTTLLSSHFST